MNAKGRVGKAKPFVKWVGGKRLLIPYIQHALPKHISTASNLTYVEPFIGGGAVLFWLLHTYPNVKKAVINDINTDLATAYTVVRDHPEPLIQSLQALQLSYFSLHNEIDRRSFFNMKRDEFNARKVDDITATTLLIFLNRTCFNGLYRVNSRNRFNAPFGRHKAPRIYDPNILRTNSKLLQRVTILNGDFAETVNHVEGNALFYFDPPYKPLSRTASFSSYSPHCFPDSSQERLAAFCRQLDQLGHSWLLSNSDVTNTSGENAYFDELYRGFTIRRIKAIRRINSKASHRGKISELLVSNYNQDGLVQAV